MKIETCVRPSFAALYRVLVVMNHPEASGQPLQIFGEARKHRVAHAYGAIQVRESEAGAEIPS